MRALSAIRLPIIPFPTPDNYCLFLDIRAEHMAKIELGLRGYWQGGGGYGVKWGVVYGVERGMSVVFMG